jgi:putative transposase
MIEEAAIEHPVVAVNDLCELFGVSRSWYYEKPRAEQKAREDVALRDAIERIVLEFPGYGYRRVTEALKRQGWCINHKKVLRMMRKESLLCQLKKRFRPTTDSAHSLGIYPNLIKDAALNRPDQGWVADITYVRLPTTFCYLASILDDYSRYCVGWSLSRWIDTRLTLEALEMALASRRPGAGLIHHSDRGVQYASGEYIDRLEEVGALISMAAVGNPYENAKAESFFRTLKTHQRQYACR